MLKVASVFARTSQLSKELAELGGISTYQTDSPESSIADVYLHIDDNHKHDIMIGTIKGEGGSYFPNYVVFSPVQNIEQFPEYAAKVGQCVRVSEELNKLWRSHGAKTDKGPKLIYKSDLRVQ